MRMRTRYTLPLGAVWLLVLAGCGWGEEESTYRYTRFAMGTVVEFTLRAKSPSQARDAMLAAEREIERIEALLWEGDSLSDIGRINRADADTILIQEETYAFLRRADSLSALTAARFDPSIQPVFALYGFETEAPTLPTEAEIADALPHVGMEAFAYLAPDKVVKADPRAGMSLAGMAKGYAVDRAVAQLRARGIRSAIVNAGGDLYCLGANGDQDWTVGVQDPDDASALLTAFDVRDRAVATSGDYQRFFVDDGRRIHHLLDPATGRPASGVRSATVLAPTTELADALATAFFIAGISAGLELASLMPQIDVLFVASDGSLRASPALASHLASRDIPPGESPRP